MTLPLFAARAAAAGDDALPPRGVILRDAQAAAYAADGCARASGRPAAVIARSTAEGLAAASALATAWGDKVPVALLLRRDAAEAPPLTHALGAVTRGRFEVRDPADARPAACRLIQGGPIVVTARQATPWAAVLADLDAALVSLPDGWSGAGDPDAESLHDAAKLTRLRRKKTLLIGAGAMRRGLAVEIAALARAQGAPALLTAAATCGPADALAEFRAAFREEGALIPSGVMPWLRALLRSDLIIALGSALSEVDWFGLTDLPIPRAPVIRVADEPATREARGAIFVRADVRAFVRALLAETARSDLQDGRRPARWRRASETWRDRVAAEAARCARLAHVEPRFAAPEILRHAPPETIFVTEGGSCGMWLWASNWLRPLVYPAQNGTLGVPVPYAIGAHAALPGRPIWGIVGDGAFFYHAHELLTAAERGVPLALFIFKDGSWSSIRLGQTFLLGGRCPGTNLPPTDFARLAALYGCESLAARTPAELTHAARLAAQRPAGSPPLVVEVMIPKNHLPYAGGNFVAAELDGAFRSLALPAAAGFAGALVRGALPLRALAAIVRVAR